MNVQTKGVLNEKPLHEGQQFVVPIDEESGKEVEF
jgi:hypothetical protein